tara:strand:+ start:543 stop:773 length:231 start_codon:yes stop_codon:yes gene_type:complete
MKMTKPEVKVYQAIKRHTDAWGWGLEESEIVEYTTFPRHIVSAALRGLGKRKLVGIKVSYVANHIFFNDLKWNPKS